MKKFGIFLLVVLVASVLFALNFKDLYPFLVDLPGWDGKDPEGSQATFGEVSMLTASRSYTKGEARLKVTIVKGTAVAGMWAPFAMKMEFEDEEQWVKVKEINGFNVGLSYNKQDKKGSIIVNLSTKPDQNVGLFALEYKKISPDQAVKLAKKFDWKGIAKALSSS